MSLQIGSQPVCLDNTILILTVGHSTRAIEEFVGLLQSHSVRRIVDVRTVPRSRHNPQFNHDTLPDILAGQSIGYTHMAGLGGLRHTRTDSPNSGWRNLSFRGFADYMQTSEFARNIEELVQVGKKDSIAVMCAEAVPWRCHRSLIADALLVRGVRVAHIMGKNRPTDHTLTPFARVESVRVFYPAEECMEAKG
jgi:uncharacterized protein (DUF488 family)